MYDIDPHTIKSQKIWNQQERTQSYKYRDVGFICMKARHIQQQMADDGPLEAGVAFSSFNRGEKRSGMCIYNILQN